MRVLHIIGATVAGGAERVAIDVARQLSCLGHEIALVGLSGRVDDAGIAMRRQLADAGIAFYCGPGGRVRLGAVRMLAGVLRQVQPDIIHLHTPNTELALALATRIVGRRAVVARTVHNVALARSRLYMWAYRQNRVRLSAACSAAVAAANADWAAPLVVIQNGVTFDWEIQSAEKRRRAGATLALDPGKRHFLSVGSMRGSSLADAQKAHDVMIAAWKQFAGDRSDCELHLVGDGNLRPALERAAGGDPSIRFWGVSSRIFEWLQAADVFLLPSRYEGLPIAGLEALGTGLPVIFSEIPSLRELDPTAAIWVKPDDVSALAAALERAVAGGICGSREDAERIRREFGIERMTEDYLQYYEQVAVASTGRDE